MDRARRTHRQHIGALIGIEVALLCVACVYAALVVSRHSVVSLILYGVFVAALGTLFAALWYVFIIRRPLWWGTQATPRRFKAILLLSALIALFLEWGTLVGAPLSSPAVLNDWHVSRIMTFFFLMLPVVSCVVMYDWKKRWRDLAENLRDNGGAKALRLLFWFVLAVVVAAAVFGIVALVCCAQGCQNPIPYQTTAVLIAVTVVVLIALRPCMENHPEKGLLVVLLSAGIMLAALVPLYTHISWDDHIHYDRALATSYLVDPEYTPADIALIGRAYNDVAFYSRALESERLLNPYSPDRLSLIYDEINRLGVGHISDPALTVLAGDRGEFRMKDKFAPNITGKESLRVEGAVTLRGVGIIEYYTIAYIPAAVALWLARLWALPTTVAFLLGRLATVLCYALVVYYAAKRLKSGKMILASVALIPTAVFLASGYSYDFWIISFLMLGFSCLIGEMQRPDEPLTWRWFLVMIGAFLVGLGPKAIYVPVAAMLLFMPRTKFAGTLTHKRYLIILFASAAFVLATFVLPFLIAGPGTGDVRGGKVDPGAQISFITQQPLSYIQLFATFLTKYLAPKNSEFILTDFCGVETAHLMMALVVLLPIVALSDRQACDAAYATHAKRISMALLVLLTLFLIATALFISFTPPGFGGIQGVQGRYLLPLLFPFFAFCCNIRCASRLGDLSCKLFYNYTILGASTFILFASIIEVLVGRL